MAKSRIRLRHVLPLAILAASTNCKASAADLNVRLPDGRKLVFHCEGTGAPAVVLEGAYASRWTSWQTVLPALGRRTRICGYDRAGLLPSDPAPLPRDGNAIATDLAESLRALRIRPPYILVGHSIGGLYVRTFYAKYPKLVAGMVLVDPSVEDQQQRFAQAFPGSGGGSLEPYAGPARECVETARAVLAGQPATIPRHCGTDPKQVVGSWSNLLSELDNMSGATSAEIKAGPQSYGSLPLIVLTASSTYRGPPEQVWTGFHDEIARRSTRGQSRTVANSGHNIPHDQPDAVITAVNDVLDMAGAPARKGVQP